MHNNRDVRLSHALLGKHRPQCQCWLVTLRLGRAFPLPASCFLPLCATQAPSYKHATIDGKQDILFKLINSLGRCSCFLVRH
ncbi:hypothetical protein FIBSPDRAFT_26811 [Athelia psychrophila]|uniref:Uncharacterized protein n=1 Tax=Athelia psychrophila TaxID=1759441 RepID=A0A166G510_9AGAM|nr:hypothetical protein FIBSPDRAFT_26811 [Fibularhizoctonia sp. CBS 109695]